MKTKLILLMVSLLYSNLQAQDKYRVAFYNVENLFDTHDNKSKLDDEFTPEGVKYWSNYKYWDKIKKISKVIKIIGEYDTPALVGLAEIENDTVLKSLIYSDPLKKYKFNYIHRDSPDRRGIDTALLYRTDKFFPIDIKFFPIRDQYKTPIISREICYSKGIIPGGDTLHVMVVHFPSKYGGYKASETNRINAANTLTKICDSISLEDNKAKILIMGDFNDNILNKSLELINSNKGLRVLSPNHGTHKYREEWNTIDHFVLSEELLKSEYCDSLTQAKVLMDKFLLIKDEKYLGWKANRTYLGYKYKGGFSDHLPIYIDLIIKK